jgi:hypothetical protein
MLYLDILYLIIEELNKFPVALLAAQSHILGHERNNSISGTTFFTKYFSAQLTLGLLLQLLSALGAHLWGLFTSFGHELTGCKLRIDG